jgi:hypothetical protein
MHKQSVLASLLALMGLIHSSEVLATELFRDDFAQTPSLTGNWHVWSGGFSTDSLFAESATSLADGNWASVVPASKLATLRPGKCV